MFDDDDRYPMYPDEDPPNPAPFDLDAWRAANLRFMPMAQAQAERAEDLDCAGGNHV